MSIYFLRLFWEFPLHFLVLDHRRPNSEVQSSLAAPGGECHRLPIFFLTSDLTNQKQEPKNSDCETSWLVCPWVGARGPRQPDCSGPGTGETAGRDTAHGGVGVR